MEKVVERIRQQRCKGCLFLRSLAEDKCGGNIGRCREEIRWGITYTLGAVHGGQLDQELGAVSRIASLKKGLSVVNPMVAMMNWVDQQIIAGADILIALPPLPGTKEKT